MKIAVTIVRILLGLLFIFSSVVVLFDLMPQPELEGAMKQFNDGIMASGYLLTLIKTVELVCGIAFVIGLFVPLATIVIFPVTVNILMVHVFLEPEGLPIAIAVIVANLFLAFACRRHYRGLWSPKIQWS